MSKILIIGATSAIAERCVRLWAADGAVFGPFRGGEAILQSRAIDESGYVQPTRAQLVAQRGLNSNYHYNAIQSWSVAANGEISNVHA